MTCSPVEAITSSSRGSGCGWISLASAIRRLVSPDIADGTTTTSWPAAFHFATRARDVLDALDRADRGAAVFLNDQCHESEGALLPLSPALSHKGKRELSRDGDTVGPTMHAPWDITCQRMAAREKAEF